MKDPMGHRLVFGDFVDRIFWGLLVCISSYGVVQIQSLSSNVAKLNESMAVVLEKMSNTKDRMDRLEMELDQIKRHNRP